MLDPKMLVIAIVIIVVVILLIREVACWYWKINNIITILSDIRDALVSKDKHTDKKECKNCGTSYDLLDFRSDAEQIFCSNCKSELPKN